MTITTTTTRRVTSRAAQTVRDDGWRERSACAEVEPDVFFPEGTDEEIAVQQEQAKAVCRRCPVQLQCLEWALENRQDSGVLGGLTDRERRSLHRRRSAQPEGDGLSAVDHILKYRLTEFITLREKGLSNGKIAAALSTNGVTVMKVAARVGDIGVGRPVTEEERESLLPAGLGRAPAKTTPRQLAVQHGAYLLRCLVEDGMSVHQVAEQLGSLPVSVYTAFLILVPRGEGRASGKKPSALETLLATSAEKMKTLERIGRTHTEIGEELGTSQSVVSSALGILRQREKAVERLAGLGFPDPLKRLRDEELRVRVQAGVGLTVDDVVTIAGPKILHMNQVEGRPLRHVARDLGLCRETVRKAYRVLVDERFENDLEQEDMEEVA